jgi:hypothetical protein
MPYQRTIARGGLRGCLLFLLLAWAWPAAAQLRLTVQVDAQRVSTSDYLHIQYTVERASKLTRFITPAFQGFTVVQGPDYTNGWTLVNGDMKEYVAISFVLQPKRKGRWVIPAATAVADGKSLRSESVAIDVSDGPSTGRQRTEAAPGDQPLDEMILRKGESVQDKVRKNLFVKLDVSRRSVYVGEPVVATYKLYTRLNSESRVVRRPSFSGFSVFDMEEPESDLPRTEKLNGVEYNVYLLRMVQLYPLQAGTYELESMQVENTVRFIRESATRDQNTLNNILRALGQEGLDPDAWVRELVSLENPPATITVKPLPTEGQPADFSGAVGQFTLAARKGRDTLTQGDAYKLDITLEGRGNLPVISAPDINWPPDLEPFEPEITESLNKAFSPMTGLKTYSIPFTPRRTGRCFLPSARLVYFDPAQGRYITLQTDSLAVEVIAPAKREKESGRAGKGGAETDVSPGLGKDFMTWGWAAGLLTVLLLALVWWYSGSRRKKSVMPQRDLESFPEPEPEPVTQLRLFPATYTLDQAKSFLIIHDSRRFYQEVARVFRSVLAVRLAAPRGTGSGDAPGADRRRGKYGTHRTDGALPDGRICAAGRSGGHGCGL